MINSIISAYYEKVPAVVCTAGSYIIAANEAAKESLAVVENKRLFDSMMPRDVLKYESDFNTSACERLCAFKLYNFHGFRYALAAFGSVLGIRFSVVFLFKDENDENFAFAENSLVQKETAISYEQTAMFSDLFFNEASGPAPISRDTALIDMRMECKALSHELLKKNGICSCDISVNENRELMEADHALLEVTQAAFVQMMLLCIGAFNEISAERKIDILLCRYTEELEVRISADAKRIGLSSDCTEPPYDNIPLVGDMFSLCNYICRNTGAVMNMIYSESKKRLTAAITFGHSLYEYPDFKSRDSLGGFSEDFDFASRYVYLWCQEIHKSSASKSNVSTSS